MSEITHHTAGSDVSWSEGTRVEHDSRDELEQPPQSPMKPRLSGSRYPCPTNRRAQTEPSAKALGSTASPYAERRAETMCLFRRLKLLPAGDPQRERLRNAIIADHVSYARRIAATLEPSTTSRARSVRRRLWSRDWRATARTLHRR